MINRKRLWAPIHEPTITERSDKASRIIPTIHIPIGKKGYPFGFGVDKAKAILQYLDAIKGFVETYGGEE
jgi:hypothetical protein